MIVLGFRYRPNAVTDILICLMCIFLIILVLQSSEAVSVSVSDGSIDLCLSFLENNHLAVNEESVNSAYVVLSSLQPDFHSYKELQQRQGFDIDKITGKRIQRLTFELMEYDGLLKPDGYYVNVYLYNNSVVAAEILSVALDGFMEVVVSEK